MRPCADKIKNLCIYLINDKPIRFQMTFSEPRKIARQRRVFEFGRQGVQLRKQLNGLTKLIHIFATPLKTLDVFFKLFGVLNSPHVTLNLELFKQVLEI